MIPEFKSLLVTALTFSTLRYFDEEKLELNWAHGVMKPLADTEEGMEVKSLETQIQQMVKQA